MRPKTHFSLVYSKKMGIVFFISIYFYILLSSFLFIFIYYMYHMKGFDFGIFLNFSHGQKHAYCLILFSNKFLFKKKKLSKFYF